MRFQCKSFANRHVENASYPDGTSDTIKAKGCNFRVITVLQPNTKCSQEGSPSHLGGKKKLKLSVIISKINLR